MKRRLALLFVLGAAIAVFKLLPWWGSLAVLAGLGVTAKLLAGRLFKGILLGAFQAKSAALAGADATLHGITPAEPAKSEREEAEGDADALESGPLRWVHIDLTVHVPDDNAGKTPFRLWDPHELRLAPVNAKPGPDFDDEEEPGTIAGVELYENGDWLTAEGKLEGSHRIRLHAGMKAGVQYFKLRYYFEILENRATVHS